MIEKVRTAHHPAWDVGAAAIWLVANLLFMRYLGQWLVVSGGLGVMLAVLTWIAALLGRARLRQFSANLLLVVTIVNFNGWAFSHLGNLVYYLGLFFFALFGLILGAALFRLLAMFRPVGRRWCLLSGLVVVLTPWVGGLSLEASYCPQDALDYCRRKIGLLPQQVTADALNHAIPRQVEQQLARHHPASLTWAYLHWALVDGEVELQVEGRRTPFSYVLRQRKIALAIRIGLSFLLLSYGVLSQVKLLDRTAEQVRAMKEGDDHSHSMVAGGLEEMS